MTARSLKITYFFLWIYSGEVLCEIENLDLMPQGTYISVGAKNTIVCELGLLCLAVLWYESKGTEAVIVVLIPTNSLILNVVSNEKEGGRKRYQSMHNIIGPWRWTSILRLIGKFYSKKHISVSALVHVIPIH